MVLILLGRTESWGQREEVKAVFSVHDDGRPRPPRPRGDHAFSRCQPNGTGQSTTEIEIEELHCPLVLTMQSDEDDASADGRGQENENR